MSNVKLNEGFTQVCVWPETSLGGSTGKEFEEWVLTNFGTRVQFLETIVTNPDLDSVGDVVPETGGREDLFFAVHNEDIAKFAIPRLVVGIRWIEDVYGNGGGYLYPARVAEYKSWVAGDGANDSYFVDEEN